MDYKFKPISLPPAGICFMTYGSLSGLSDKYARMAPEGATLPRFESAGVSKVPLCLQCGVDAGSDGSAPSRLNTP